MSILIKGMDMPKSCGECLINYMLNVVCDCDLNNIEDGMRLPDCPLIEQKTGKWIDKWYCSNMSGYEYAMKCSECGKPTYRISFAEPMPNYCPNCGVRMVEE